MRTTYWTTLAAALVMIQAACTVDKAADESRGTRAREAYAQTPAAAPTLVTVTATEFAFSAPATIPAGLTTFRLVSQGRELHHVQMVRLEEGHTVEDLIEAIRTGGEALPAWAYLVGGPNAHAPGAHSEATMDLEPGQYALVCFIPSGDGVPHVMKGMIKPVTVVPATRPTQASAPAPHVRMTLRDYAFEITPEITAGRRSILVRNAAQQPHEVFVARLAPGKTPQDLLAWFEAGQEGPPPAVAVGGTTFMAPGESNQITADFEPGEYALYCFVPDASDGKPHVAHGMMRQISVR